MDSGTSIFAGFVTFSMLGFIAHEKGETVKEVVTQGTCSNTIRQKENKIL